VLEALAEKRDGAEGKTEGRNEGSATDDVYVLERYNVGGFASAGMMESSSTVPVLGAVEFAVADGRAACTADDACPALTGSDRAAGRLLKVARIGPAIAAFVLGPTFASTLLLSVLFRLDTMVALDSAGSI
jgi:hypothetical protein